LLYDRLRGLLAKHRLIVPADGFYEWRRGPDLARQPYYIRRANGGPLALAGLWASWHDPERTRDDSPLRSATILTTGPNSLMGQIHNRMPVIVAELDWDRWLDPTLTARGASSRYWGPHPTTCSRLSQSAAGELRPKPGSGVWSKRSVRHSLPEAVADLDHLQDVTTANVEGAGLGLGVSDAASAGPRASSMLSR